MSIDKQLLYEKCLSCVSLNLLRDLDKNYFIILWLILYFTLHIQINFKPHYCSKMLLCMDIKLVFTHYLHTAASAGRWRRGNIFYEHISQPGAVVTWDQVTTAPGWECRVSIATPPPSVCHPHVFALSHTHCLSYSSVIARSKVLIILTLGLIILTLILGGPLNIRGTAYL